MIKKLAIIKNGVVTNIAIVDDSRPKSYQSLGGVIADDTVAIGWMHDGNNFIAPVVVITEEKRIAEIKQKAGSVILARYPQWKQANMTARMLELVNKKTTGALLTTDEQAEETAITAAWEWVKSIRAKSDAAELSSISADEVNWS